MKVTFLGTNGWYDTATGNTPSVFVSTETEDIIFDAGFGFIKARQLIEPGKPILLFLSHFHLDHIIGLHTLPLFKFSQGIDIYLPHGTERYLRAFLKRPYTTPSIMLGTKIRFHDFSKYKNIPFEFECARLRHSVPCYGFSIKADGVKISYCTDTGLCGSLKRLAGSSDLFITECSMAPGDKSPNLFHITPETAARVAKESGAKRLALFHFDPGKYPTPDHRKAAEAAARVIFPETTAADDGTAFSL